MATKRKNKQTKPEGIGPRYFIDIKALEENGRSFSSLLSDCACEEHAKSLKQEAVPARKGQAKQSPMAIIESCCSTKHGYLSSTTPTLEAIFKVLVAHQDVPMTADDISGELITYGVGSSGQRDISPRVLTRLMDNDDSYGFVLKLPEEKSTSKK
ncbi:MAG: hypothetical protein EXR59_04365 [Dehalococcoidia bacterium]|nr:hypothetical protein [Dehalococcoidia bacterium]